MVSDLYSPRKRLDDGGSLSGFGMENIREDRSRAPPGDTARDPISDEFELARLAQPWPLNCVEGGF